MKPKEIEAAVVHTQGGLFKLERIALEPARDDEVIVKIAGVGICHADLICRDQHLPVPLPCVFGHEGSGVVESVGWSVADLQPGDHVVLSFNSCKICTNCMSGKPAYCSKFYQHNFLGTRMDGSSALSCGPTLIHGHFFGQSSFSTYAVARERNVVKVSREVPLWLLGPLGCGVQTGAGAVMNTLRPQAGSSIAVFGAGAVGLSAIMAAALVGCATIVAVDPINARRDLALNLGATHAIDPGAEDPVEAIRSITGSGVQYSLECIGLPVVVRQSVRSLCHTGACGIIGIPRAGAKLDIDLSSLMSGRSIRGIVEGDSVPQEFIPRLIELYRQGRFPFDKLITEFAFDDIQEAVAQCELGKVIKPVLRMPTI